MAMDSNGVEAAASSVASSAVDVHASSVDAVGVDETKTITTMTSTTTSTTTSSSSSSVEITQTEEQISSSVEITQTEEQISSSLEVKETEEETSSSNVEIRPTEEEIPTIEADELDSSQTVETEIEIETETETEELETVASTTLSSTPPKASNAKKWYMPKVPSLLKKPSTTSASADGAAETSASAPPPPPPAEDDDVLPPTDELRSLTEAPVERATVASRLRGLSIDQNAFARSLVGKINGFRSQSIASNTTNESPRTSIDGVPSQASQPPRHSLLNGLTSGVTAGNVPSPRSDPNLKARRGACVSTKFGTGTVLDIRLDDGFYIVQLVPKSIAYLRDDMIVREIKAIVGERVKTRWGLATVEQYYADDDMYNIALDWRWDDDHVWRMKATTKKFEKISRGLSIVQNTKNRIFTGYSTIRESASYGYANVAAKINTASTYKPGPRMSTAQAPPPPPPPQVQPQRQTRGKSLGKALTPYGLCTVIEVRPDQFFVVQTKCGATGYLHADAVKLLHRRTHFAVGERVKTPYGHGDVVAYRDEDEVYEVKLELAVSAGSMPPILYMSDAHAETLMMPASANGANYARLSSIFTMTRNSVYSASATVKASATGGLTTLSNVKSKVSTMAAIKMTKAKFQKGERVITSFGSGFVSDARPLERIYEVQLRRLKFHGYFHETALQPFPYERVTHFIVDGKTIPAPDMPKNLPEHKRRDIITTAIRQARSHRQPA